MLPRGVFLRPVDASKCVFGRGSAPDPAGGAYSASANPLDGFEEGNGEGSMERATGEKKTEGKWNRIGAKWRRRKENGYWAIWGGKWGRNNRGRDGKEMEGGKGKKEREKGREDENGI